MHTHAVPFAAALLASCCLMSQHAYVCVRCFFVVDRKVSFCT